MAVEKTIEVLGLGVEIWEQSFRVEGMARVVFVGPHMTESMIVEMVEGIYGCVQKRAHKSAVTLLMEHVSDQMYKLLEGAR